MSSSKFVLIMALGMLSLWNVAFAVELPAKDKILERLSTIDLTGIVKIERVFKEDQDRFLEVGQWVTSKFQTFVFDSIADRFQDKILSSGEFYDELAKLIFVVRGLKQENRIWAVYVEGAYHELVSQIIDILVSVPQERQEINEMKSTCWPLDRASSNRMSFKYGQRSR